MTEYTGQFQEDPMRGVREQALKMEQKDAQLGYPQAEAPQPTLLDKARGYLNSALGKREATPPPTDHQAEIDTLAMDRRIKGIYFQMDKITDLAQLGEIAKDPVSYLKSAEGVFTASPALQNQEFAQVTDKDERGRERTTSRLIEKTLTPRQMEVAARKIAIYAEKRENYLINGTVDALAPKIENVLQNPQGTTADLLKAFYIDSFTLDPRYNADTSMVIDNALRARLTETFREKGITGVKPLELSNATNDLYKKFDAAKRELDRRSRPPTMGSKINRWLRGNQQAA